MKSQKQFAELAQAFAKAAAAHDKVIDARERVNAIR